VADQTDISQFIPELGAETGSAQVSQVAPEVGADSSSAQVSQLIAEASVGPADSPAEISQLSIESGPSASEAIISQLTIELGRGPEVIPPADTPTQVFTFDAGLGNDYFLALQPSDSGIEGRDKVVKAVRVTGKINNGLAKVYAYGPVQNVDVSQVEQGIGQKTAVALADSTMVQQSKRYQVNVSNAMMHLVRIEGRWDGTGDRDRIDEIFYEIAQQGIRR
jgi:hypothetical protein